MHAREAKGGADDEAEDAKGAFEPPFICEFSKLAVFLVLSVFVVVSRQHCAKHAACFYLFVRVRSWRGPCLWGHLGMVFAIPKSPSSCIRPRFCITNENVRPSGSIHAALLTTAKPPSPVLVRTSHRLRSLGSARPYS
jgi:hypothetical protein